MESGGSLQDGTARVDGHGRPGAGGSTYGNMRRFPVQIVRDSRADVACRFPSQQGAVPVELHPQATAQDIRGAVFQMVGMAFPCGGGGALNAPRVLEAGIKAQPRFPVQPPCPCSLYVEQPGSVLP